MPHKVPTREELALAWVAYVAEARRLSEARWNVRLRVATRRALHAGSEPDVVAAAAATTMRGLRRIVLWRG